MTYKILLADDSVTIQKVVELTFADSDFSVLSVGDGLSAYRKIKEIMPDVILLDIFMPEMNGYQVCEKIKNDPMLKYIPVLLLTGTFESFDEEKANNIGANGFLTKPFESSELIARVEEQIKNVPKHTEKTSEDNFLEQNIEESSDEPAFGDSDDSDNDEPIFEESELDKNEPIFEETETEPIEAAKIQQSKKETFLASKSSNSDELPTFEPKEVSISEAIDSVEEEFLSDGDEADALFGDDEDEFAIPKDDASDDLLWEISDEDEEDFSSEQPQTSSDIKFDEKTEPISSSMVDHKEDETEDLWNIADEENASGVDALLTPAAAEVISESEKEAESLWEEEADNGMFEETSEDVVFDIPGEENEIDDTETSKPDFSMEEHIDQIEESNIITPSEEPLDKVETADEITALSKEPELKQTDTFEEKTFDYKQEPEEGKVKEVSQPEQISEFDDSFLTDDEPLFEAEISEEEEDKQVADDTEEDIIEEDVISDKDDETSYSDTEETFSIPEVSKKDEEVDEISFEAETMDIDTTEKDIDEKTSKPLMDISGTNDEMIFDAKVDEVEEQPIETEEEVEPIGVEVQEVKEQIETQEEVEPIEAEVQEVKEQPIEAEEEEEEEVEPIDADIEDEEFIEETENVTQPSIAAEVEDDMERGFEPDKEAEQVVTSEEKMITTDYVPSAEISDVSQEQISVSEEDIEEEETSAKEIPAEVESPTDKTQIQDIHDSEEEVEKHSIIETEEELEKEELPEEPPLIEDEEELIADQEQVDQNEFVETEPVEAEVIKKEFLNEEGQVASSEEISDTLPESVPDMVTEKEEIEKQEDITQPPVPETVVPTISEEEVKSLIAEKIEQIMINSLDSIVERVAEKISTQLSNTIAERILEKLEVGQLPAKAKLNIEEIAWEVVPDLAEVLIKREIETIKASIEE